MDRIELLFKLIEIKEGKAKLLKLQQYENASKLRDEENRLIKMYEKNYDFFSDEVYPDGSITHRYDKYFTPSIKQLETLIKGLSRDQKIDEILKEDKL